MNSISAVVRCPHDHALCVSLCPITQLTAPGEWNCLRQQQGMSITQGLDGALMQLSDIEHPAHYGSDSIYETIKVAEAWGFEKDAYLFLVLKYISRAGKKPGESFHEDLKKALFYLERRIGLPE